MSIDYPALSAWPCDCLIQLGEPDEDGDRIVTISTTHTDCQRLAWVLRESEMSGIEYRMTDVHAPDEPA